MRSRGGLRRLAILVVLAVAVGIQALEIVRFPGGLARDPIAIVPITLEGGAVDDEYGRYSLVTAIRETAPGAHVLLDPGAIGTQFSAPYLRTLGRAARVELRTLPELQVERAATTSTGRSRQGDWTLSIEAERQGPVETLLIVRPPAGIEVLDAALVPSLDLTVTEHSRISRALGLRLDRSERTAWTVLVDVTLMTWLLLLGGLLTPRASLTPALRIPMAFLAGTGWVAGIGVLLLPGVLGPLGASVAALVAGRTLTRRGVRTGWSRSDLGPLLLFGVGAAGIATLVRARGLVVLSPDSFFYWTNAHALAAAELTWADLTIKRPLGLTALHSPGFTLGAEGVLSLGVVVIVAAAAILVALPRALGHHTLSATLLGVVLGAFVLTSAKMMMMAAFLNTHVLVAAMLLLVGLAGVLHQRGMLPAASAAPPAVAALMGLVMFRAEAVLLVGLVLVGMVAMDVHGARSAPSVMLRSAAWSSGAMLGVLGAVHVAAGWVTTGRAGPTELLVTTAGVAVVLAPHLLARIPASARRLVPVVVGVSLWLATGALLFTPLGADIRFLEVARVNLWEGAGKWGVTAPMLAALAAAAVLGSSDRSAAVARWTVIGFVPSVLLSKLLDGAQRVSDLGDLGDLLLSGGGRTGWFDSVNRMWMHVALVVLLLALVAVLDGPRPRPTPGPRARRAGGWVVPVVFGVLVLSEVSRWQPEDLGPIGPPAVVPLVVVPTDGAGWTGPAPFAVGEVWAGTLSTPDGLALPTSTRRVDLCVTVTLSTPGSGSGLEHEGPVQAGALQLEVVAAQTDGELRTSLVLRPDAGSVDASQRRCLRLDPVGIAATRLALTVTGSTDPAAHAFVVVPGPDGTPVTATLEIDAPTTDPRPRPVRFASATVRAVMAIGPIAATGALLVLVAAPALRRRSGTRSGHPSG